MYNSQAGILYERQKGLLRIIIIPVCYTPTMHRILGYLCRSAQVVDY